MHKSERLFQLVNILKSRRLAIRASDLAARLNVSERTIYRDIQHLQHSGVPIEGEAGIGYVIDDYDLPPMMFTLEELQALLLGSKMVSAWTDPVLAEKAHSAITKIEAVLPDNLKQQTADQPYLVSGWSHSSAHQSFTYTLRQGIEQKRSVNLHYSDANNQLTTRTVEPLGLVYWGGKWTLVAYCQLRNNYREFRLDRIQDAHLSADAFCLSKEKNLDHYVALIKAQYGDC
ncbi:helix-turn-helix transcriptional regulator [Pseudoalteromonas ulvae]|uniref:DNA-binding transcriptional regulator n=1 Tax=Pseudoalteromonas ulvae TaxID=107327 RepID=A0A244CLV8_PSEDV|nr:YafY family protein [Pseudoalteromonas ulvae]OUL56496.1 DNA-binding transcriptional regulator [Pseudoalteromonas ulvae]